MSKHLPLHRSSSSSYNSTSWLHSITKDKKRLVLGLGVVATLLFFSSGTTETIEAVLEQPTPYRLDFDSYPSKPLTQVPMEGSVYTASDFSTERLHNNTDLKPVTAVIYRVSQNEQDIVNAVHHLLNYPFIREIYVHNPMTAPRLRIEDLALDVEKASLINVEIFEESNERLASLARFTTCAMASFDFCYFQDDQWKNNHLDTLYSNFIRYPSLLHASSPPAAYIDQLRWRLNNNEIALHTGYADLQFGAFSARWKAQNFMTQLGKSVLGKDRIRLAEFYFSIWSNQYPWILEHPIALASGEMDIPPSTAVWPSNLRINILQAIRRLTKALELDLSDTPKDYFERIEEAPRLFERDAKAVCVNDRCLFTTNMEVMSYPTDFQFSTSNITNIPQLEATYNDMSAVPSNDFWEENAYHRAVDQDPNTCWNTFQSPRKNDYFGLITLGTWTPKTLEIITASAMTQPERTFQVSVTENGDDWTTCKTHATSAQGASHVKLELTCGGEVNNAKAVRVTFAEDRQEPFSLCSLALNELTV